LEVKGAALTAIPETKANDKNNFFIMFVLDYTLKDDISSTFVTYFNID